MLRSCHQRYLLLFSLCYLVSCLSFDFGTYSLGFDFGTSGVRCCVINSQKLVLHEASISWSTIPSGNAGSSNSWSLALRDLINKIPRQICQQTSKISVSGTSSSVLLFDINTGKVSREPRMYDFNIMQNSQADISKEIMDKIKASSPPGSAAYASTSTLAKLLLWHFESPVLPSERLVHQADFIANQLLFDDNIHSNRIFTSDWHNALKLGYDVQTLDYPIWLKELLISIGITNPDQLLPKVVAPGRLIGNIRSDFIGEYSFPESCEIVGGTTDSIAAFLASGATKPGQAVTSLGSTLAVKLLSERAVADSARGIYSHRLGNQWLVGGASNVGCAVLRQLEFSNEELDILSAKIDPATDAPLRYYPLCKPGERFPVNDPEKTPVLSPVPDSRSEFLHSVLQGIADVERSGYEALVSLGATPPTEVLTCGGGARNDMWTRLRARLLGVPVRRAENVDAAFGAACLAQMYDSAPTTIDA